MLKQNKNSLTQAGLWRDKTIKHPCCAAMMRPDILHFISTIPQFLQTTAACIHSDSVESMFSEIVQDHDNIPQIPPKYNSHF